MLLVIVVGVLTAVAVASFVVALRKSADAPRGTGAAVAGPAGASHVGRLHVGGRVDCDGRTWQVVGAQRGLHGAAPVGSAGPAAAETPPDAGASGLDLWHLEDRGQRGLLEVDPAAPGEIVVSVAAEAANDLDPDGPSLVWRDLTWRPLDGSDPRPDDAPVQARTRVVHGEGLRQLRRGDERLAPSSVLERVAFTNPDLPRRRLTFLRERPDDVTPPGPWAVWIGDRLPVVMLDAYPPADEPS
ncbi:MAG: hypothetical protein M0P31_03860 [Solirubrobacteraceae bacterium]|nr:hypothetical protein [Solirubrobacteraceae bacterium]